MGPSLEDPLQPTSSSPAANEAWSEQGWRRLEETTRGRAQAAFGEAEARRRLSLQGRRILRSFSTSFFLASRFLPRAQRRDVELIYAAVRYPDELVDTFPLAPAERRSRLDAWQGAYELAIEEPSIQACLDARVPTILAGFSRVVRERGIPAEHYRTFLDAMRLDAAPVRFATLDDLIDRYVHGSAVVVGYFLGHVYGPGKAGGMAAALEAIRHLSIALQLTNFLRDVGEDWRRGRLYLPLGLLADEGVTEPDLDAPEQAAGWRRVIRWLARAADEDYQAALDGLESFSAPSRPAIRASIQVYRELNRRIALAEGPLDSRLSVPWAVKLKALPPSKYWRLPLAYLGWL